MSQKELKQILMDLQLHSDPQYSEDGFANEVIESMIDAVLDGKLELRFKHGVVSYTTTEEGKKYVENMEK